MRRPRSTAGGTELDLVHDMAAEPSEVERWAHNLGHGRSRGNMTPGACGSQCALPLYQSGTALLAKKRHMQQWLVLIRSELTLWQGNEGSKVSKDSSMQLRALQVSWKLKPCGVGRLGFVTISHVCSCLTRAPVELRSEAQ
eukprot:s2011_g13.t4